VVTGTQACEEGYNRRTETAGYGQPARKGYTIMIENFEKCHWEDFLVSVDEKSVWTATSLPFW